MSGLSVLAAGIGATAGAISDYVNTKRQNKQYQRELADSRANWNMQNAYNSPSNQMARLRAAGLNPNLIYQSGSAFSGAGEIGLNSREMPDFGQVAERGIDAFNAGLQSDSVKSAIELNKATTENTQQDTLTKSIMNKWLPKEKRKQLAQMNANINLINQQRDYYEKLTGLTSQQVDNSVLEYQHIDSQIKESISRRLLNDANVDQIRKMIKQIEANTDLVSAQYQKAVLENWFQGLLKEAYSIPGNRYTDFNIRQAELQKLNAELSNLNFLNSTTGRTHSLLGGSWFDSFFKIGNALKYEHNGK